jgi:purine-nucleoside phosphorylase
MLNLTYGKITESVDFLKKAGIDQVEAGIILGTGLGRLVDHIQVRLRIPYESIPGFAQSTVESHQGALFYGAFKSVKVLVMSGRFHHYEGYSFSQLTFPVRVMKVLGIRKLFISNAAGSVNKNFKKGDLMLIEDHINLLPGNPLTGPNIDQLGPRFPDMSCPYDPDINSLIEKSASKLNLELKKGVYAAVAGPNLETRAEYRFLSRIGADAVGMSTVPEVIVANHMGLPCSAISVITDECDPDDLKPVNIAQILEVAGKAEEKLISLMSTVFSFMNQTQLI